MQAVSGVQILEGGGEERNMDRETERGREKPGERKRGLKR